MRRAMIVLASLAFVPISAPAETWIVKPDGSGDFPDIQSAVDAAVHGDEILLTDGVFSGLGNYRVNFLGKAITIRSASGNASACVIDCGWGWGFELSSGEGPSSVVADLTILRTGHGPLYHGIRANGTSPTIRGVIFRSTYYAIWSEGGSPRLEDSVLEDGCNLYINSGSSPVVTGCVWEVGSLIESRGRVRVYNSSVQIENCTGDDGGVLGGVILRDCSAEIRGCEFRNTQVRVSGDAVDVLLEDCSVLEGYYVYLVGYGSNFVVRNCTIQDNDEAGITMIGNSPVTVEGCDIEGNHGPGVKIFSSTQATLRDCMITGNAGGLVSTGFPAGAPPLTIEDCTIASNDRTPLEGGGLYLGWGARVSLQRTILWGNCAPQGPEVWMVNGTLELDCVNVDTTRIVGDGSVHVVGDLLQGDPLFCEPIDCTSAPAVGGDYTLREDSPALLQPCGVMGGQGVGCEPITLESTSWGAIKALYR